MGLPCEPHGFRLVGFFILGEIEVQRVACIIDGFNLYHAIQDLGRPHLKWVNLWALAETLISPKSQQIAAVYYCTALAYWMPDRRRRHETYIHAQEQFGVTPVIGVFKDKQRKCKLCKGISWGHEEKQSDVNVALCLVGEAHKNTYDAVVLITADSDLVPALRALKTDFPGKRVILAAPPGRPHSSELLKYSDEKRKITVRHLERCLMADEILDASGVVLVQRPKEYEPPSPSPGPVT